MRIPKAIQNLVESFERLPGIGPKSAQRLTFYLLHVPQGELDKFAKSVQDLRNETKMCSVCFMVDETDPCSICSDPRRDESIICVVEQPLDVIALEKNRKYNGIYHVLHGKIDPLNNIGPDEIYIKQLFDRLSNGADERSDGARLRHFNGDKGGQKDIVKELILATNPTMEGEATAMYITKHLKNHNSSLKITRIGRGLPIGSDIEYADEVTLQRAMEGRQNYD